MLIWSSIVKWGKLSELAKQHADYSNVSTEVIGETVTDGYKLTNFIYRKEEIPLSFSLEM